MEKKNSLEKVRNIKCNLGAVESDVVVNAVMANAVKGYFIVVYEVEGQSVVSQWSLETFKIIAILGEISDRVTTSALNNVNDIVLLGFRSGKANLYDVTQKTPLKTVEIAQKPLTASCYLEGIDQFAVGMLTGVVSGGRMALTEEFKEEWKLTEHKSSIRGIEWCAESGQLLTCEASLLLCVWRIADKDKKTFEQIRKITVDDADISLVHFNGKEQILLAMQDGEIRMIRNEGLKDKLTLRTLEDDTVMCGCYIKADGANLLGTYNGELLHVDSSLKLLTQVKVMDDLIKFIIAIDKEQTAFLLVSAHLGNFDCFSIWTTRPE
jgi:WD40 repeat protein